MAAIEFAYRVLAGGVVAMFQGTIDKLTIRCVPCRCWRANRQHRMPGVNRDVAWPDLGEIKPGDGKRLVAKEGLLRAMNGAPIGFVAGAAMFWTATAQGSTHAWVLAQVVLLAMTGACMVSGISGAIVPLTLKRFGADPATASSIFHHRHRHRKHGNAVGIGSGTGTLTIDALQGEKRQPKLPFLFATEPVELHRLDLRGFVCPLGRW